MPPAVVPPPTILCRLRSEKAYCGSGGRGFESRHLQEWFACIRAGRNTVGGAPTPRDTNMTHEIMSKLCESAGVPQPDELHSVVSAEI